MRPEKLYLVDIIEAAESIQRFIDAIDEPDFLIDELRQSAVLQKLIVIGEAATRLSDEFCTRHPEIEWQAIKGFRKIAVHEYFAMVWEIAWATVQDDVPGLKHKVEQILKNEFID